MTSAYPLAWPDGWPRTPDAKRKAGSNFRTTFDVARREIYEELERLGATSVVLSSHIALRLDGRPRADQARMMLPDPGVAVYFSRKGRPMVLARDAYRSVHDNLRSIGLALEYLRGLERHGGAHMVEKAFTGFVALSDKPHWRSVLTVAAATPLRDVEVAYRQLAKTHQHDHDMMVALNAAVAQAREEMK